MARSVARASPRRSRGYTPIRSDGRRPSARPRARLLLQQFVHFATIGGSPDKQSLRRQPVNEGAALRRHHPVNRRCKPSRNASSGSFNARRQRLCVRPRPDARPDRFRHHKQARPRRARVARRWPRRPGRAASRPHLRQPAREDPRRSGRPAGRVANPAATPTTGASASAESLVCVPGHGHFCFRSAH